jgi:hypothetical protein
MIVTIHTKTYTDGVHFVNATVSGDFGTLVGPYSVELPEDATDADITAAIEAIFNPPKPVVKKTSTKKTAAVVEPVVDSSGASDGQDPSVDP